MWSTEGGDTRSVAERVHIQVKISAIGYSASLG